MLDGKERMPLIVRLGLAIITVEIIVVLLIAFISPAKASNLTIQPSYEDSVVSSNAPTTNYGSVNYISLYDSSSAICRDFLKYSTASVPDGSTVNSATLSVNLFEYYGGKTAGKEIQCKRVTSSWSESTVTWNNQPSTTATDMATASYSSSYTGWVDFNVTNLVIDAMNNRSDILDICLKFTTEAGATSFPEFHSREYTDNPTLRPMLFVDYTPGSTPTPTPTPAPTPIPDLIVGIGDSLTYGYPDCHGNCSYPQVLEYLLDDSWTVVDEGVLADEVDDMWARFQTDVIDQNPYYVIIWGGVNDLIENETSEHIATYLQYMFSEASSHGIVTIGLNIAPCDDWISGAQQTEMMEVNTWLSESAIDIDYMIDIHNVLEGNATYLKPEYDSGDGIHLNSLGYSVVAATIYSAVWSQNPSPTPTVTSGGPSPTGGTDVNVILFSDLTLQSWLIMVLALGLSFISIKQSFIWFIACFAWIAFAALAGNSWIQGIAIFLAIASLGLFITATGRGRG